MHNDTAPTKEGKTHNDTPIDDQEWLAICSAELDQSIGFGGYGQELQKQRTDALNFAKGEMGLPKLTNRSQVKDTAMVDAIETLIPDLMEIFTGGDDIATFQPENKDDIDTAKQETRAIVHTVMEQNDGFNAIYDYCKDALLLKTGLFKVYWGDEKTESKQILEDVEPDAVLAFVGKDVEVDIKKGPDPETGLMSFEIIEHRDDSRAMIETVAPEDFTVGADTIMIKDATYCAMKAKRRAQDLIADGFDPEKVDKLSEADSNDSDAEDEARDTVELDNDEADNPALARMRMVEIHEHYVRVDPEGTGKLTLYQVVTDASEDVLLSAEEVDTIPFAAGTPYRNPHKFYGTSIADKMMEIQKINTALQRMLLDSGYFALNQRHEIDMTGATENTLKDYKNNIPGSSIRVKRVNTINPVGSTGLTFDAVQAIESMAVIAEQRTGIVRNAQGLNPDTLHDTARGAQILMNASQKRMRLIARLLAHGIKDMYLLVHDLMRGNGKESTMRLTGDFIPVDPSKWGSRRDMKIMVGVGSGGKQESLSVLDNIIQKQAEGIQLQGGTNGPLITTENIYNAVTDFVKTSGLRGEDRYFSNPAKAEPQPPKPDPEAEKMQAEMQMKAQEAQVNAQMKQQEMQFNQQAKQAELEGKKEIAAVTLQIKQEEGQQKLELTAQLEAMKQQLAQEKAAAEIQLAEAKAIAEMQLAEQKMNFEAQLASRALEQQGQIAISKNRPGGDLDK